MSRGNSLIPGLLGSVAIAMVLWQNHAASERMTKLADRVERLAARPVAEPIVRTVAIPAFAAAPASAPARTVEKDEASPAGDARVVAAERRANDVISSGHLTAENVLELRAELDGLSRTEAFEIRRRIVEAINTDQLVPTQIPFDLP